MHRSVSRGQLSARALLGSTWAAPFPATRRYLRSRHTAHKVKRSGEFQRSRYPCLPHATLERSLAKVRVEGSNPFARSNILPSQRDDDKGGFGRLFVFSAVGSGSPA